MHVHVCVCVRARARVCVCVKMHETHPNPLTYGEKMILLQLVQDIRAQF